MKKPPMYIYSVPLQEINYEQGGILWLTMYSVYSNLFIQGDKT